MGEWGLGPDELVHVPLLGELLVDSSPQRAGVGEVVAHPLEEIWPKNVRMPFSSWASMSLSLGLVHARLDDQDSRKRRT